MDPQLLETLTQSRWAIAFVTAAVATVWLRQRGQTQRAALLCATACETADPSIPRAELLEEAKSTKVSTFAQIVLAFGKLPEVTQRRCSVIGIIMSGAVPLGVFMSVPIFVISNDRRPESTYYNSVYNYPSNTIQADPTGATRLSATKPAVSTPRSIPASKSPPALPDRISVVSVSATLESEAMSPSPPPNPIDTGVASFPRPTIDSLIAADSHSMPVDGSVSQRQGRFDRLAALTQWSCHDNATATARMEF
jgi:hypothetical protein